MRSSRPRSGEYSRGGRVVELAGQVTAPLGVLLRTLVPAINTHAHGDHTYGNTAGGRYSASSAVPPLFVVVSPSLPFRFPIHRQGSPGLQKPASRKWVDLNNA